MLALTLARNPPLSVGQETHTDKNSTDKICIYSKSETGTNLSDTIRDEKHWDNKMYLIKIPNTVYDNFE